MRAGLRKKTHKQAFAVTIVKVKEKSRYRRGRKREKSHSALKGKVLKKKNCFYVSCSAANKCVKADMIILLLACSVNSVLSL